MGQLYQAARDGASEYDIRWPVVENPRELHTTLRLRRVLTPTPRWLPCLRKAYTANNRRPYSKRSGPPILRSHFRRRAAVVTIRRPSYPNASIFRPIQARGREYPTLPASRHPGVTSCTDLVTSSGPVALLLDLASHRSWRYLLDVRPGSGLEPT